MNDLRVPIGSFFAITGILLLMVSGMGPSIQARLTTANVDLYCGASMLVFGSVMLWLARRSS
jgi:hypothetical protein